MRRFFYSVSQDSESTYPKLNTLPIGAPLALTETITHHWCRVLRASIGDQGVLFDGFGGEYLVELIEINKKQAYVTLLAYISEDNAAPIISKLGLSMSRGERMDYAVQKSVELGVTAIQLLTSHHGEVTLKPAQIDKKLTHWQQIAIAACEQCGLNRPPLIFAPLSIDKWLLSLDDDSANRNPLAAQEKSSVSPVVTDLSKDPYYQPLYNRADLRLMLSVPSPTNQSVSSANLASVLAQPLPFVELLIGPEGGLSADEQMLAQQNGFEAWQIGNRVLRTETAPVVALATLHALSSY